MDQVFRASLANIGVNAFNEFEYRLKLFAFCRGVAVANVSMNAAKEVGDDAATAVGAVTSLLGKKPTHALVAQESARALGFAASVAAQQARHFKTCLAGN